MATPPPLHTCRNYPCYHRHTPCAFRHRPCAFRHRPCAFRHRPCYRRHAPCALRHRPCYHRHTPCALRHRPCYHRHTPCALRHRPCYRRHTPCALRHRPCYRRHTPCACGIAKHDSIGWANRLLPGPKLYWKNPFAASGENEKGRAPCGARPWSLAILDDAKGILSRSSRGLNAVIPPGTILPYNPHPGKGCQQTMSTYLSLHYHLVFSTKHREPWLPPSLQARVHEYIGGLVHGLGGEVHGVGGTSDHIHLLISLRATHCLADFMRELKKASSAWIRETFGLAEFGWQEGYCAMTVSPSARSALHHYIANQEEHHGKRSSQEELLEFLQKAGIAFDPKYLP